MLASPAAAAPGEGDGDGQTVRWLACILAMAMPLLASAQGARVLSTDALAAARSDGAARVLVMLRTTHSSGPDLSAGRRESDVRAVVDRVLADLPAAGAYTVLRRYAVVPAIAMRADAATLRRLARHPGVRRIDLDVGGAASAVAPDEASVLNRVSGLKALGLDGRGMKVAVIDSGLDTAHPDLRTRLVGQQCFCSNTSGSGGCCPNNAAQQSGAGAAEDANGHGTNVTGIVVGTGAVAPVGAVPATALVAVRVLDADNRFCCTSDIVAALDWLAANHPDVDAVNLSLGTDARFAGDCDASTAWTQALSSAIAALNARGAVVVVSSGNRGDLAGMEAPACIRNALGVAATWDADLGAVDFLDCTDTTTAARKPTCFSNRSPTTDLFAAGAFVTSAGRDGGVSTYGGTSMAAPMVAACAVALKQAAPLATVPQRMDAMKLSLTRINDPASGRVYPFLDCNDAVRLLNPSIFDPIPVNGAQPLIPPT